MGFWDKVKRFFGGGRDDVREPDDAAAPPAAIPPLTAPPTPPTLVTAAFAAASTPARTARAAPAPAPTSTDDSARFRNPAILGLSADELRTRALRITPYRPPWIGRVDTSPPQSDERTAIIDRGLILRGLLTAAQIEEIHRIPPGGCRRPRPTAASSCASAAATSA